MIRIAGLIGDPVDHSLSPVMHRAAMVAMKLEADYRLWPTALEDIPAVIGRLRADPAILGANVTVPHKQNVMPFMDELAPAARAIGAVNTIIPRNGRLVGDNTDAYGWAAALREAFGTPQLRRAVVLGAGGASRAILQALINLNCGQIVIANRSLVRAEALAAEFGAAAVALDALGPDDLAAADILVNATSAGWHQELPIPRELFRMLPPGAIVSDLTYTATPFLQAAAEHDRRTIDGLGMLIHQGARSLELWTGLPVPVEIMRAAVTAEQARRAGVK